MINLKNQRDRYQHRPEQEVDFQMPLQPEEDVSMIRDPTILTSEKLKNMMQSIPPNIVNLPNEQSQLSPQDQGYIENKMRLLHYADYPSSFNQPIQQISLAPKNPHSNTKVITSKSLINNFITNLFSKSYIYTQKRFQPEQWAKIRNLLGDFKESYDYLSQFKYLQCIKLFEDLFYWDTAIMFITFTINFWNIIRVGGFHNQNHIAFDFFMTISLLIDILVTFNRSLIQGGTRISDHKAIFFNYLKGFLLLDLLALMLLIFLYCSRLIFWVDLLFTIFFLIVRYRKMLFMKLHYILSAVLVVHFSACLWHRVGMMEGGWDSLSVQYHYSVYWAVSMLQGSNNIGQLSQLEMLVSEVVSLGSLACYIIVFYVIVHWKQDNLCLINYMKKNGIKIELQQRVLSYLQEAYKNEEYQDIFQSVGRLPKKLRDSVQQEVRGNLLKQCTILKYFISINKLINCLEEVRYSPDEIIEDRYNDSSLYIISDGEIQLDEMRTLKRGDYFGEFSFFTGEANNVRIICRQSCHLLVLKRDDFLDIISTCPLDYEVFSYIKDKISLYHDFSVINMKCVCCHSLQHLSKYCPSLHYEPDREWVIKKHLFSPQINRQKFQRFDAKKKNSRIKNIEFQKKMGELQQLYIENQSSFNELSGSQLPYDDQIIRDSYNSASSLTKQSKSQGLVQNSFIKQQSTYEQNSFPTAHEGILFYQPEYEILDYDLMPSVLMKDPQFIDQNKDEFINLVRKNEVKRTFATAGFGQQSIGQQSMKQSLGPGEMQIIQEKDSDEFGSHSNDPSSEEIKEVNKPKSPVKRKGNEPKLTFNYQIGGENQSNNRQNSIQSRQGSRSSRSLTYTPLISQASNNFSHRSISKIYNNSSSQMRGGKTSYQSGLSGNSNIGVQTKNLEETSLHRGNTRKKSTYTKVSTKVSIPQSGFAPFSGLEVLSLKIFLKNPLYGNAGFGIANFDRMILFQIYFPYNNYDLVIKEFVIDIIYYVRSYQAKYRLCKRVKISNYLLDIGAANLARRLRKFTEKQQQQLASKQKKN